MPDALVLLLTFAVTAAVGVPIAYALGLAAIVAALWVDIPLEAVMLKISDGSDDFALLAIPFFVLAGAIMAEAALSFVGLGAQPPTPSWGSMVARSTHLSAPSPAAIAITK